MLHCSLFVIYYNREQFSALTMPLFQKDNEILDYFVPLTRVRIIFDSWGKTRDIIERTQAKTLLLVA